jgi:hypothetical protein
MVLPYPDDALVSRSRLWRCRRLGVGAHSDWQVMGTIDYTVKPWVDLHLGYRSLNFDYTASGGFNVGFNVHMRGPLLAATFKF